MQIYHDPYNAILDFLDQKMDALYQIMIHTTVMYSFLKQKTPSIMAYP